jgi:hypothetical protein
MFMYFIQSTYFSLYPVSLFTKKGYKYSIKSSAKVQKNYETTG